MSAAQTMNSDRVGGVKPGEGGRAHGVCPFCGEAALDAAGSACGACGAKTDPLSRQATQNEMGPWFVRDPEHPFRPGCRLETLERWVRTGRVKPETVVRGPTTNQNWTPAGRVPGLSRLFGWCHACDRSVRQEEVICGSCGAALHAERDRQHLGLSAVRPLPGRGPANATAASLLMREPVLRGAVQPAAQPARGAGGVAGAGAGMPAPSVGSQDLQRQSGARAGGTDHGFGEGDDAEAGGDRSGEHAARHSRESVLVGRLARARRAGRIATGVSVASVVLLGVVFVGVRQGWIVPMGPGSVESGSAGADTAADSADTESAGLLNESAGKEPRDLGGAGVGDASLLGPDGGVSGGAGSP